MRNSNSESKCTSKKHLTSEGRQHYERQVTTSPMGCRPEETALRTQSNLYLKCMIYILREERWVLWSYQIRPVVMEKNRAEILAIKLQNCRRKELYRRAE